MITREALMEAADSRFTKEVHDRLRHSAVAIAGLGGLGSHVAVMLARCAVGKLLLVDFDTVEVTNLNRQAYGVRHLGMKKTEALTEILREINPYIEIERETVYVNEENIEEIFSSYEIVCEAFDSPECKASLVNTLMEKLPKTKIVAASGMAGYGSSNRIQTEKKMKNFYLCGDQTTDIAQGIGLMAPRVQICAGHQGNMIVRLILGQEEC
ncbi:MAG: sulfur carrier protein ThiS adenylyltransferase ThiF [Anaerovoracaceae bacterium]